MKEAVVHLRIIERRGGHPIRIPRDLIFATIQPATMPPKRRTISKKLVEQEGRILLVILSLQKKEIPTIYYAATVFGVPYSTLRIESMDASIGLRNV